MHINITLNSPLNYPSDSSPVETNYCDKVLARTIESIPHCVPKYSSRFKPPEHENTQSPQKDQPLSPFDSLLLRLTPGMIYTLRCTIHSLSQKSTVFTRASTLNRRASRTQSAVSGLSYLVHRAATYSTVVLASPLHAIRIVMSPTWIFRKTKSINFQVCGTSDPVTVLLDYQSQCGSVWASLHGIGGFYTMEQDRSQLLLSTSTATIVNIDDSDKHSTVLCHLHAQEMESKLETSCKIEETESELTTQVKNEDLLRVCIDWMPNQSTSTVNSHREHVIANGDSHASMPWSISVDLPSHQAILTHSFTSKMAAYFGGHMLHLPQNPFNIGSALDQFRISTAITGLATSMLPPPVVLLHQRSKSSSFSDSTPQSAHLEPNFTLNFHMSEQLLIFPSSVDDLNCSVARLHFKSANLQYGGLMDSIQTENQYLVTDLWSPIAFGQIERFSIGVRRMKAIREASQYYILQPITMSANFKRKITKLIQSNQRVADTKHTEKDDIEMKEQNDPKNFEPSYNIQEKNESLNDQRRGSEIEPTGEKTHLNEDEEDDEKFIGESSVDDIDGMHQTDYKLPKTAIFHSPPSLPWLCISVSQIQVNTDIDDFQVIAWIAGAWSFHSLEFITEPPYSPGSSHTRLNEHVHGSSSPTESTSMLLTNLPFKFSLHIPVVTFSINDSPLNSNLMGSIRLLVLLRIQNVSIELPLPRLSLESNIFTQNNDSIDSHVASTLPREKSNPGISISHTAVLLPFEKSIKEAIMIQNLVSKDFCNLSCTKIVMTIDQNPWLDMLNGISRLFNTFRLSCYCFKQLSNQKRSNRFDSFESTQSNYSYCQLQDTKNISCVDILEHANKLALSANEFTIRANSIQLNCLHKVF